jgi:hypothetical protein
LCIIKDDVFLYFARKSLASSDNSCGISGGCLSLPSLSSNAPVLTTEKISKLDFRKEYQSLHLYEMAFYQLPFQ